VGNQLSGALYKLLALMNHFFSILFLFFTMASASSQFYDFGQDPAALKWKVINTEHFKIVFPEDFGKSGQNLAKLMEKNYLRNSAQLNHEPAKIPLIIHNQTVYSNAFVTWAPRRMEFFTFPDPALYPIDWLNELSLHEFRHVIQIDKVNQGFTRVLSFILGQQATGVVAGMMPLWFIEGDAVSAETELSFSGRGRLPSFDMPYKAQLNAESRPYSLSKAYLGSYNDFVADYYQLGYHMVTFARKTYGDEYWTKALNYIGRRPFLISPYFFYSKKSTGGGANQLYKKAIFSLKSELDSAKVLRSPEIVKPINIRNSDVYASYTHPCLQKDSSVIVLKSGLDKIPGFVRVNKNGAEENLFTPGSLISRRFSVFKNSILWDEYVPDIRWSNRSYSVIKEFNIETGKCRTLSHKSKYTSPSWSPGGDSILVINTAADYKFSLVILRPIDGQILRNITLPENLFPEYPVWITGTSKIAVIAAGDNGKALLCFDMETAIWTEIFNSRFKNIDQLKSINDLLFFNASFEGTDDIYVYSIDDRKLGKLSNSEYGAFFPDAMTNINLITYSSYSAKGYDIVLKPITKRSIEKSFLDDTISKKYISFEGPVLADSTILNIKVANHNYPEKKFNKISNLFGLHSWAPYWFDYMDPNIDDPKISPGLTLLSQNSLSTAFMSLGYERNNGMNFLHTGLTYKGFLPIFEVRSSYGGSPMFARVEGVSPPETDLNLFTSISTYIPLTFSRGKAISGIQPSLKYTYNSTYYYNFSDSLYEKGVSFVEPRIFLYSYLRTTSREIQPRIGLTIDARHTSAPFESGLYGMMNSVRINLYLPGIIKNHGLKLRTELQNQKVDSYYLQNHLSLPRGYQQKVFISMKKISADYSFPIFYPDLAIGPVLYIKRIRGNFYLDYMKGTEKYISATEKSKSTYPLSQGLELMADYHLFRFIFELSTGVRFVYLPHENLFGTQLIFHVNLDKFI